MFIEAFQRDEDFEEYDQHTHLDLETGEVIWNANNTFIPEVTL